MSLTPQFASPLVALDFDGVVVDSNGIKGQALFDIAKEYYGLEEARQLLAIHSSSGGIPRELKFRYFAVKVLQLSLKADIDRVITDLNVEYRNLLKIRYFDAELAPNARQIFERLTASSIDIHIVSGGRLEEIKNVLNFHALTDFVSSINGDEHSKQHHLKRIQSNYGRTGLFIGDSYHDALAARETGWMFVFLTDWSDANTSGLLADNLVKENSIYRNLAHFFFGYSNGA